MAEVAGRSARPAGCPRQARTWPLSLGLLDVLYQSSHRMAPNVRPIAAVARDAADIWALVAAALKSAGGTNTFLVAPEGAHQMTAPIVRDRRLYHRCEWWLWRRHRFVAPGLQRRGKMGKMG